MKLKHVGLGVAAVLLAAEVAFIPAEASALLAPRSGPQESPGGTYFLQNQLVNFCFSHGHGPSWLEWNSVVLGNCPPGDVQLSVWADPQGIIPAPSASASP